MGAGVGRFTGAVTWKSGAKLTRHAGIKGELGEGAREDWEPLITGSNKSRGRSPQQTKPEETLQVEKKRKA